MLLLFKILANFLHASIFRQSIDIGSGNVNSSMSIKLTLRSLDYMLWFPSLMNVDNWLWFLTKQRSRSFELVWANRQLSRSPKARFYFFKSFLIDGIFFALPKVLFFFSLLIENWGMSWICIINSGDSMSPTTFQSSISLTQKNLVLLELIEFFKLFLDLLDFFSEIWRRLQAASSIFCCRCVKSFFGFI